MGEGGYKSTSAKVGQSCINSKVLCITTCTRHVVMRETLDSSTRLLGNTGSKVLVLVCTWPDYLVECLVF